MQKLFRAIAAIALAATIMYGSARYAQSQAFGIPDLSFMTFSPGLLAGITGTTGSYYKIQRTMTVDNIEGSAISLICVTMPVVTMSDCGTSTSCASPVTIGTVTISSSGTMFDGTITNPVVQAGHFVSYSMTGGVCTTINLQVTSQLHTS